MRRSLLTALLLVPAACGDTTAPPSISIVLATLDAVPLDCRDRVCTDRIVLETRNRESNEPIATLLHITGDGDHPEWASTTLPEGRTTLHWSYPAVPGNYRLRICPTQDTEAGCAEFLDFVQNGGGNTSVSLTSTIPHH